MKHTNKYLLIFAIAAIASCGGKSNGNAPDYDLLNVTEYANDYNDGRLVKVVVTETTTEKGSAFPADKSQYEHVYIYQSGTLTRHDEYDITDNGRRELLYSTIFTANTEESIGWDGSDTTSYRRYERDTKGRIVRTVAREIINAPAFDFVVNDNFDERTIYDGDDDSPSEIRRTDLATGQTRTTKIFRNTEPSIVPAPDVNVIYYQETKTGDTLVTRRYENGVLKDTFKEYGSGGRKYEHTFSPAGDLVFAEETIGNGGERITITRISELQSTDSTFYRNDRVVRTVVAYPDQTTTTLTDYDPQGNPTREARFIKYHRAGGRIFE